MKIWKKQKEKRKRMKLNKVVTDKNCIQQAWQQNNNQLQLI
jgi:hypothetical protein